MENNGNTLGASLLEQEIPTTKSTRADTLEITDHAPSSGAADAGPTVWTKKKVILFTRSVFIDGYYVFMLASATGLLMCALWPLSENLGGNKIQLGVLVATHAVGKGLFASPMATLTEHYKHRHTLIVGNILQLIGSALWAFSPLLGGIPMLYIAQLTLGIHCATLGTARAFVVEQTRPNRRTHVLGRLSALEYAGHFVMPIVGALLIALGATMSEFAKFALPAFLLFIMGCVSMYLLVFHFEDIKEEDEMTEEDYNPVVKQITPQETPTQKTSAAGAAGGDIEQSVGGYTPPHSPVAAPSAPVAPAVETTPSSGSTISTYYKQQASTASAAEAVEAARTEKTRVEVYKLVMLLNFTIRGCLAAYGTLTSEIILNQYDLSYFALGGLIAGAGAIGTVQLLGFKELWTSNFSDPMLLLIGFSLLGFSQVFVVNWNQNGSPKLWEFGVGLYAVMAVGFPIAISAALGAFSVLQRVGHQSNYHAHLILVESAANIVVPVLSGVLEECVRKFTTFSVIMVMMAVSIIVVMRMYEPLMQFTDRTLIGKTLTAQRAVQPKQLSLDNRTVRQGLIVISIFLALVGVATFLISAMAGRT